MIFVILFILIYLAIATLVYGSFLGGLRAPHTGGDRIPCAILGLLWPITLCVSDAREDLFSDHPLKF